MLFDELQHQARAIFLGVALGDALGATTEFMTPAEIKHQYQVHKKNSRWRLARHQTGPCDR